MSLYRKSERWLRGELIKAKLDVPLPEGDLVFVDFSYKKGICAFGYTSQNGSAVKFDTRAHCGELKAIRLAAINCKNVTICCDEQITVNRINFYGRGQSVQERALIQEIQDLSKINNLKVAYINRKQNPAHKLVKGAMNEAYQTRQSSLANV
jgi:hypothetical protein